MKGESEIRLEIKHLSFSRKNSPNLTFSHSRPIRILMTHFTRHEYVCQRFAFLTDRFFISVYCLSTGI